MFYHAKPGQTFSRTPRVRKGKHFHRKSIRTLNAIAGWVGPPTQARVGQGPWGKYRGSSRWLSVRRTGSYSIHPLADRQCKPVVGVRRACWQSLVSPNRSGLPAQDAWRWRFSPRRHPLRASPGTSSAPADNCGCLSDPLFTILRAPLTSGRQYRYLPNCHLLALFRALKISIRIIIGRLVASH